MLDEGLPDVYDERLYGAKCAAAFDHVFTAYHGGSESVYATA